MKNPIILICALTSIMTLMAGCSTTYTPAPSHTVYTAPVASQTTYTTPIGSTTTTSY